MRVVWNEENKYLANRYGHGPFEVFKIVKDHFPGGRDAYFINLYGDGLASEGNAFYASRFDIVSEELVDLDDML